MNEIFGKRLRDALYLRGVSQKELAERIGISQTNINHYAKGRILPRTDHFFKICEVLNVSPDFLLGKVRGIKV